MGAFVMEALAAADRLAGLGFEADVVVMTSPGLLFRALQARRGLDDGPTWIPPLVTVLDGHPHTLAFLAGVNGVPAAHLGVSAFGQSGDLDRVYRCRGLDVDMLVGAALDLVD